MNADGRLSIAKMHQLMTELMERNIADGAGSKFRKWMMPGVSTTTECDRTVASVVMMRSMEKYPEYGEATGCAMVSVTLMVEREDYQSILVKQEYLDTITGHGKLLEAVCTDLNAWVALLRPTVDRIVQSWSDPDKEETKSFWREIAQDNKGSSTPFNSGWITAFCFFSVDGKKVHP